MPLHETPEKRTFDATPYVYIEKEGPFMKTAPQAWADLRSFFPYLAEYGITGAFSRFILYPSPRYRACVSLTTLPTDLPEILGVDEYSKSTYMVYTLTGSYFQLPEACQRVDELIQLAQLTPKKAYHMERYVNDPDTTPEAELITEICIPIDA